MGYYYTYIIFSESTGRYYIGHTHDLTNRLFEHNSGETKSNKAGIPWMLMWSMKFESRSEAMAIEKKIKSRGAARFLIDQQKS